MVSVPPSVTFLMLYLLHKLGGQTKTIPAVLLGEPPHTKLPGNEQRNLRTQQGQAMGFVDAALASVISDWKQMWGWRGSQEEEEGVRGAEGR